MTSIREDFISTRFNEWLERFTPPRGIANNLDAQQKDANALLATVLRFAPAHDYGDWYDAMIIRLEESMETRAWPVPGSVAKACRSNAATGQANGNTLQFESQAVDRMADWYSKFKAQMPGHGRDTRTADLIRRGTLANEREARFRGFSMSDSMNRTAMDQPMGRDEWRHHIAVTARLRGVDEREVEAQIREELRERPVAARGVSIPDKTANTGWAG